MLRQVVDAVGLVAAPCEMACPHFAACELRRAIGHDEHPRALVARLAVAAVARDGADRERRRRRLLLKRPASGELREMVGAARHRHRHVEPVDDERFAVFARIRNGRGGEQQAAFGERQTHVKRDIVDAILGAHVERVFVALRRDGRPTHEHRRVPTVRLKPRTARERLGALRQDRRTQRRIRLLVGRRHLERHDVEHLQRVFSIRHVEIAPPILDLRHLVDRCLEHDAYTVAPQYHMGSVIEHRCLLRILTAASPCVQPLGRLCARRTAGD